MENSQAEKLTPTKPPFILIEEEKRYRDNNVWLIGYGFFRAIPYIQPTHCLADQTGPDPVRTNQTRPKKKSRIKEL